MKLLPKHNSRKHTFNSLTVIDADGDSMVFDSVKKVAEFLEVNASRIYAVLRTGSKVRGCTIKNKTV